MGGGGSRHRHRHRPRHRHKHRVLHRHRHRHRVLHRHRHRAGLTGGGCIPHRVAGKCLWECLTVCRVWVSRGPVVARRGLLVSRRRGRVLDRRALDWYPRGRARIRSIARARRRLVGVGVIRHFRALGGIISRSERIRWVSCTARIQDLVDWARLKTELAQKHRATSEVPDRRQLVDDFK
jgi:hypothetical protein